jgi:putative transposase
MTKDNYIAVYIHFVWATKNFENVLDKSVRYKLFDHIYKDANLKGIKVKIVNGVENHIHCLVSMLTTQTIAEVAKQLKGESSHWFNENNPNHYQKLVWQNGYGAISVISINKKNIIKANLLKKNGKYLSILVIANKNMFNITSLK